VADKVLTLAAYYCFTESATNTDLFRTVVRRKYNLI